MTKWLGGKTWTRLHRLVYISALGGVIHYLWLVKADTESPLAYGAVLTLLLAARLWFFVKPKLQSIQGSGKQESPR
jgi:sulfoxide reductase heme-binding subunit YedZ